MNKKVMWLVVSCLMALSLVMAACAPATVEEKKPAPVVEEKKPAPVVEEKKQEVAVEKKAAAPEAPKYGGTVTLSQSTDVTEFDETRGWHVNTTTMKLTNEELWEGDWTKGPAGTGEVSWTENGARWDQVVGRIAESWKFSPTGRIEVKIRQGIRYALNPASEASRLVGGRELTADDVVYSLIQNITQPTAWLYLSIPALRKAAITAPDKWTVIIEVPPEAVWQAGHRFFDYAAIFPPEVMKKYGNMMDWRNSVGSGSFMLTEYVPASSWTVVKNPNYWQKDPIGPGKGNQLPYLDGARFLIIPDASTRQAALRTGKIDQMGSFSWEDAALMKKTAPELVSKKFFFGDFRPTAMHTDKPELPFKDIRVRRALFMATDFKAIVNSLYGGDGVINTWPIDPLAAYADAYLPLEEMPPSVQELYTYNPEKSKQLLKEAGYPNGFKTKILIGNQVGVVDYYSIIKDMWSKVGVDLTLDIREWAVYWTMGTRREYEQMIQGFRSPAASLYEFPWVSALNSSNGSYVNDSHVDEVRQQIMKLAITDVSEAHRLVKELTKYVLEQAWVIPTPGSPASTFWWPWLKNYHGEANIGYFNTNLWLKYVWLDQNLKKAMGY